jgi:hypothetical protein
MKQDRISWSSFGFSPARGHSATKKPARTQDYSIRDEVSCRPIGQRDEQFSAVEFV